MPPHPPLLEGKLHPIARAEPGGGGTGVEAGGSGSPHPTLRAHGEGASDASRGAGEGCAVQRTPGHLTDTAGSGALSAASLFRVKLLVF